MRWFLLTVVLITVASAFVCFLLLASSDGLAAPQPDAAAGSDSAAIGTPDGSAAAGPGGGDPFSSYGGALLSMVSVMTGDIDFGTLDELRSRPGVCACAA